MRVLLAIVEWCALVELRAAERGIHSGRVAFDVYWNLLISKKENSTALVEEFPSKMSSGRREEVVARPLSLFASLIVALLASQRS
jgi:hypothetical protein